MNSATARAKAKILLAMYRSVDRMNSHIVEESSGSAVGEQRLQINLRKNFRELKERKK